jgi:hypothetical protein
VSAPDGVRKTGNISVIEVVPVTNRGSFGSKGVGQLMNKDIMVKEPPDSKDDYGCH